MNEGRRIDHGVQELFVAHHTAREPVNTAVGQLQRIIAGPVLLNKGRPLGRKAFRIVGLEMTVLDADPVIHRLDRPLHRVMMEIPPFLADLNGSIRPTQDPPVGIILDGLGLPASGQTEHDRRCAPTAIDAFKLQDPVDRLTQAGLGLLPGGLDGIRAAEDLDERNPVDRATGEGADETFAMVHGIHSPGLGAFRAIRSDVRPTNRRRLPPKAASRLSALTPSDPRISVSRSIHWRAQVTL